MRIDVMIEDPSEQSSSKTKMVSFVQAHDSFRQCVSQSCAEFALNPLVAFFFFTSTQRHRDKWWKASTEAKYWM
jgi:hypothetical protein